MNWPQSNGPCLEKESHSLMTHRPRLALIGSGNIAGFHVSASRKAGFDVTSIASRPGSIRLQKFATDNEIPHIYDNPDHLIDSYDTWDALLICSSIESTFGILENALTIGAPILVEKPVSRYSATLAPLLRSSHPVIVGYNRRFYSTVNSARKFSRINPQLIATLTIPESIKIPENALDSLDYMAPFFYNSVHGLDLARFVLGNLELTHVQRLLNDSGLCVGIIANLISETGSILQFCGNWSAPANFSLTLDRLDTRFELKPFESAAIYEGMKVLEPTEEIPLRSYIPKES